MDQSTQEIKKYIDQLAKPVRDIVLGNEWHKRIGEIGQKYSLHLDQISSLEYEVLFVMIGMEPEEDLIANIQRELSISKILATQLAEETNTRIFQFILKSMQAQSTPKTERFEQSTVTAEIVKPPIPILDHSTLPTKKNPQLLSEIETLANNAPKEQYHVHTAPPPPNLPGQEVNSQQITVNSNTKETPSFVDVKLNTPVVSPVLQATVKEERSSPVTTYTTGDPYREPVE